MFCHANNLFWTLEQIDADAVEAPKVPSGMTGGVEYEAMAYCVRMYPLAPLAPPRRVLTRTYVSCVHSQTAHLRLINEIARTCPSTEAAFAFHEQLFLSGFERVLFVRANTSSLPVPFGPEFSSLPHATLC